MTAPTDEQLLADIAAGDVAALRTLYHRHHRRMYNTALGYLQVPADAEEVTQDVFTKVWRAAASFEAGSKVTTWMYRIAVNTALTAMRRRKRRSIFRPLAPRHDPPDFRHPGARLEDAEALSGLFAAVYRLPPSQQTAFLLSYVEELPRQQVADVMDTSLKAVESLLMRAKKKLRTHLRTSYPNR